MSSISRIRIALEVVPGTGRTDSSVSVLSRVMPQSLRSAGILFVGNGVTLTSMDMRQVGRRTLYLPGKSHLDGDAEPFRGARREVYRIANQSAAVVIAATGSAEAVTWKGVP